MKKIFDITRKSDKRAIFVVSENEEQLKEIVVKLGFVKTKKSIKQYSDCTEWFLDSKVFNQNKVIEILEGKDVGQVGYKINIMGFDELLQDKGDDYTPNDIFFAKIVE